MEAFCPQYNQATKENTPILITTGVTAATDIKGLGPDLMISVRTAAMYFRFGNASTTVTASGTASTQGMWLPQNTVLRIKKPQGATHIATLQDTNPAQVFIQSGDGI